MRVERRDPAQGEGFDALMRRNPQSLPRDRFPHAATIDGILAAADAVLQRSATPWPVIEHLVTQQERLGHAAGARAARRLSEPGALAVMTGQQPALFGGPLLSAHKALTAWRCAAQLQQARGAPVVAMFWVHSVDHDLAEANRVLLPKSGDWSEARLSLPDRRCALSNIRLTTQHIAEAQDMLTALGMESQSTLLPCDGESLPAWSTRCLLAALPDDAEIVIADAQELMRFCGPFFEECLARSSEVAAVVEAGTRAVERSGREPQVSLRHTNHVFVADEQGQRRPAEAAQRALAREHAERFSPGVLLRPALQQWLFPVCAHVNGPAENAYFAQLPELFASLHLPLPAALPRASVTWFDARALRWCEQLGMTPQEAAEPQTSWAIRLPQAPLSALHEAAEALLAQARNEARDAGVAAAADVFEAGLQKSIGRFENTLNRRGAERAASSGRIRHRLAAWLHPQGVAQERKLTIFAALGAQPRETLRTVFAGYDAMDTRRAVVLADGDPSP